MESDQLVRDFNAQASRFLTPKVIAIFAAFLVLGLTSGYLASKGGTTNTSVTSTTDSESVEKGKAYGVDDTKTFKDQAEGIMKEGGIDGEGQYHLVRPGGESQNVYLTSSIVDLSLFLDRKVKVWGQTQKAQSAGWLMDVGRVEVLE
jgi:hypothetical protein